MREWLLLGGSHDREESLHTEAEREIDLTLAEARQQVLSECDRHYLHQVMAASSGNISAAARRRHESQKPGPVAEELRYRSAAVPHVSPRFEKMNPRSRLD